MDARANSRTTTNLEELFESREVFRGLLRFVVVEQCHGVVQMRQVVAVEIQGLHSPPREEKTAQG